MTSRERILTAAIVVFAKKGRHGARMEEIAAEAAINKAMIYYIFHSKDELYFEVIKTIFTGLFDEHLKIYNESVAAGKNPVELLTETISENIDSFSSNKNRTRILIDAVSNGAEEIPLAIAHCKEVFGEHVIRHNADVIDQGKEQGYFRDISTDQIMLSIMGMAMIFFTTHSLCDALNIKVGDEAAFLEERKQSIIDLTLNGLLTKKASKL